MLPFQITRMFGLKSKTHGFALVSEAGIQLVFRDAADIKQQPDEEADCLVIQWDNLARIEAKRGLLSDELVIEVHVMVGQDPDGRGDKIIHLEVQKRDREKLDRFEKNVKDYQTGQRQDDVDEVLDDVRDFLDQI